MLTPTHKHKGKLPQVIKNLELMDAEKLIHRATHEMHHVGFVALEGGYMPSLQVTTRKEMAHIITYLSHLEGMATFAQFNGNPPPLLSGDEEEYFQIYKYFANNPHMAKVIDRQLGRKSLTSLITAPSENFISTYAALKELV